MPAEPAVDVTSQMIAAIEAVHARDAREHAVARSRSRRHVEAADRMRNGRVPAALANIPDCECRDGPPERVIRRKHPVVTVPVLPRRRHEIGEPVEELNWRELDNAIGPRPGGLSAAAGPDPVGGFVSGEQVADFGDAAVCTTPYGESLEGKGWPGAVSKQVFQALKIARHVAVDECDPDTGVY